MSQSERNIRVAKKWFGDMWSEGNAVVAREIVHPDYDPEWIGISKKGPAQVIHEMSYFRSIFPDLRYEILDIIADTSKVWVRYRGTGTQKGSAWGFPATGKPVTFEGVIILKIDRAGQVTDQNDAFCFYDILQDLGLLPPLWELKDKLKEIL